MLSLAAIAEETCKQANTPFDKASCTLTHAKKTLDLDLPWRFSNINSGAKLQLAGSTLP